MKDRSSYEDVTDLWKMYEAGISYQNKIGLRKNIPEYVRFYEGKQWPESTENTKNLPRPVINIVKMICRNKKSSILSSPVRITYKCSKSALGCDCELFNKFAENIQNEIGQEALDKNAVKDGVIKGSYFYHYYWDVDSSGQSANTQGALRCELIDPLNIFFANPQECDEQKQKWILISSREDRDAVIAGADEGVDKELIVADEDEDNAYKSAEQDEDKLVTVLTRYFRRDGEVYCEKATKRCIVNKAFSISPDIDKAREEIFGKAEKTSEVGVVSNVGEDAPNTSLPDAEKKKPVRSYLYPIVAGAYEPRDKCIYGLSEVEGLIPNQKAINFNIAMSLLNAQEIAWGKYVVAPNALKNQKISNVPGQVLVDYTGTGNGIKKLTEQSIQSAPTELVNLITTLTRNVTGSSEVMTGETIGANMSGAAIAQLQSQAQRPIEELRDTFWIVKKKQGKVLAQFFKQFYYDKSFSSSETDKDGNEITSDYIFNSSEFKDTDFEVYVEATSGTRASVAGDISMLETCLTNGQISLETFIKAYPDSAITNKEEILKQIAEEKASELNTIKGQLEAALQKIQSYETYITEQGKVVEKASLIINENKKLKEQLISLYSEAKSKIAVANDTINRQNSYMLNREKQYNDVYKDAKDFAKHIVDTEGYPEENGGVQTASDDNKEADGGEVSATAI